eukprot:TRINITY_DN728_c0_g1_i1.p1 TRINITY_DN728_c0_g1~~TRINITY_DN728_c0_g1_i1.p1  ORF type:complete len:977 (-),score=260.59 TRINITY_DN728_c0_g1_i1:67-2865(-)
MITTLGYADIVVKWPRRVMYTTLAISLFIMAGQLLRGEPEAELDKLWLETDGYEQNAKYNFQHDWYKLVMTQMIAVRKGKKGQDFFDQNTKGALLEIWDAFDYLRSAPLEVEGEIWTWETHLCYIGPPNLSCLSDLSVPLPCLRFTPFEYWGNNRTRFLEDPDIHKTITPPIAYMEDLMYNMPREYAISGLTYSDDWSVVTKAEAVNVWMFVDQSPSKMADPKYAEGMRLFEEEVLKYYEDQSKFTYIRAYGQNDMDIVDEIENGVLNDFLYILGAMMGIMVCHGAVIVFAYERKFWRMAFFSFASVGMAMGCVFGTLGWLITLDLAQHFEGDGMMLFKVLTIGVHHYHIMTLTYRETLPGAAPAARIPRVLAMAFPPMLNSVLIISIPLLIEGSLYEIEGARVYTYSAGYGTIFHLFTLAGFWVPWMVLCCEKEFTEESNPGLKPAMPAMPSYYTSIVSDNIQTPAVPQPRRFFGSIEESADGTIIVPTSPVAPSATVKPVTATRMSEERVLVPVISALPRFYHWLYAETTQRVRFITATAVVIAAVFGMAYSMSEITKWTPDVQKADLAPKYSYCYKYGQLEVEYFLDIPMPVEVVFYGEDITSHDSAVAMYDLYNNMLENKWFNSSILTNYFIEFNKWCATSVIGLQQCNSTRNTTTGYTTAASWTVANYLAFVASDAEKNGMFAIDIQCTNNDDGTFSITQSKWVSNTIHGAFVTYEQQRDGTQEIKDLVTSADIPAYAYNEAFPFLQMWGPAEEILVEYSWLAAVVSSVLLVLTLDIDVAVVLFTTVYAVVLLIMGFVYAAEDRGFNMTTAPSVLMFPCITLDFSYHMAYFHCSHGGTAFSRSKHTAQSLYPIGMLLGVIPTILGTCMLGFAEAPLNYIYFEQQTTTMAASVGYSLTFFLAASAFEPAQQALACAAVIVTGIVAFLA